MASRKLVAINGNKYNNTSLIHNNVSWYKENGEK